jgi:hypothetical protein
MRPRVVLVRAHHPTVAAIEAVEFPEIVERVSRHLRPSAPCEAEENDRERCAAVAGEGPVERL